MFWQIEQRTVFSLSSDKVFGVDLSANGQGLNFYNPRTKKFYTLSADGQNLYALSEKKFYEVENVYWSNDKSKAIITYPDKTKILYDFSTDKQISLSKQISDPVFSKKDKVAYKYISEDKQNNWLVVADSFGGQAKIIESLGDNYNSVQVDWSTTNEVVAFYAKPIGLNKSEIFFIGLQGENNKSLIVDGDNFKGLWSPSGARIIYHVVSNQNNYNPMLWIVDASSDRIGQHKINLGLSTWVDKCIFSDELTVYCAVPRELPQGAGFYPELADSGSDLIYKIDLSTELKKLIANPVIDNQNNFSVQALYLSDNKDILFFWDKNTKKIYSIHLK